MANDLDNVNLDGMRWHFVQTHSGHEKRAAESLREHVRQNGMDHDLGEVLLPMEAVIEVRDGNRVSRNRKLFPGYILVQMRYTTEMWHAMRGAPRVIGFVGFDSKSGGVPPVVPESQVEKIKAQMQKGEQAPAAVAQFARNDAVRVIDGPFKNFTGTVEEVNNEKGKVRVLVSIFGRSTPVELDFVQVEPVEA